MALSSQYSWPDRAGAALDTFLLAQFARNFAPVLSALEELPGELRHPALHLMEGLYKVQREDRDKASLLAAAERSGHKPTGWYRVTAFFIAARGILEAATGTFNATSRKSRAALGKYLVRADKGQRPSKAGFECADSRCGTEASGESIGDAFAHRSPGVFDAIAPDLGGLSEGVKKTVRLAIGAQTPWINPAPHFGCSALKGVYQACRKENGTGHMNAVQLEDYHYGRRYEWLVDTVEERMGFEGFDAYRRFGLALEGTHDDKFVNAMALELGLIVGRMTTGYLQACIGNSSYRPAVVVSAADPGRSVSIFDPSRQRFCKLPAAAFPWPFYLSGVDRILGLGESRKAALAEVSFPAEFPALMGPLERARDAISAKNRPLLAPKPAETPKKTGIGALNSSFNGTKMPCQISPRAGDSTGRPVTLKVTKGASAIEPPCALVKAPSGQAAVRAKPRRAVAKPSLGRRN